MLKKIIGLSCLLAFWANASWGAVNWVDFKAHDDVAYFLFQSPQRIARYDLVNEQFLSPINLTAVPEHLAVDADGLFVTFGQEVRRYDFDGSGEAVVATFSGRLYDIDLHGSYAYVVHEDTGRRHLVSVNKSTGAVADSEDIHLGAQGISISTALSKAFLRSVGVSPSDILVVDLEAAGALSAEQDSPYHGDFPNAIQTYQVIENDAVTDDSGTVYAGSNLEYLGSLGGAFEYLLAVGTDIFAIRNGNVHLHGQGYVEAGRWDPSQPSISLASLSGMLFSFHVDGSGQPGVEKIAIDDIPALPAAAQVDPTSLKYDPSHIKFDSADRIFLLSELHKNAFEWSVSQDKYVATYGLTGDAEFMEYRSSDAALIFAYPGGRITQMTTTGTIAETGLANSPQSPCGLVQADAYLFVCDPSGAWYSFITFDTSGALVDWQDWKYFSSEYVWNPATRRIFHLRDSTSPNDIIYTPLNPDGTIASSVDSPEHSGLGKAHPIRVRDDGALLVLGSGRIYNAGNLEHIDDLGEGVNDISDAAWLGQRLGSLRNGPFGARFEYWTELYQVQYKMDFDAEPLAIFAHGAGFEVVVLREGAPDFESLVLVDSDGDLYLDQGDAFPADPSEWRDSDGDDVGDNADAFPDDPTETTDSDNDGTGDNADAFPDDPSESADSDGDGVGDNADAFPNDSTEAVDSDNDGTGDNADAFPTDPTESADSDGDGVGDNADAFPNDPSETADTDGDGTGDNADAFPDDPAESADSDGDGVGDNADAFPDDSAESSDSDGDGVGDNNDAMPDNPSESSDLDEDGTGDNADTDDDNDGRSDAEEAAGPNGGDGNNDGVPDNRQLHVTTFRDASNSFLTLDSGVGTSLANVTSWDVPNAGGPPGIVFPNGIVGFDIQVPVGGAVEVKLFMHEEMSQTTYYKYGPRAGADEGYYEFLFDGTTGAEFGENVITLHLVDGMRGDNDMVANGVIVDPGGPASQSAASGGGGGGCVLAEQGQKKDPLFFLCLMFAAGYIGFSRRRSA